MAATRVVVRSRWSLIWRASLSGDQAATRAAAATPAPPPPAPSPRGPPKKRPPGRRGSRPADAQIHHLQPRPDHRIERPQVPFAVHVEVAENGFVRKDLPHREPAAREARNPDAVVRSEERRVGEE